MVLICAGAINLGLQLRALLESMCQDCPSTRRVEEKHAQSLSGFELIDVVPQVARLRFIAERTVIGMAPK
jgi:hypothetical protein